MKSVIDEIEDDNFPCYFWSVGKCFGNCTHPCTEEYEDEKIKDYDKNDIKSKTNSNIPS